MQGKELKVLELAKESETSQFIAVYGRRRIGKTTAQSGFIQTLDYFWNSYANARKDG